MSQAMRVNLQTVTVEAEAFKAEDLDACVIHEVRQPLSAILLNGEACNRWLDREAPDLEEAKEMIRQIINDANRVHGIVTSMRSLLAKQLPMSAYCVVEVIEQGVRSMRPIAERARIEITLDIADELPSLMGTPDQLNQVVINLLQNAVEAIERADPALRQIFISAMPSSDGVEIKVSDTGTGIPPEHERNLFEPYFTTRAEGTGLGLAISRRIVEAQGGTLDLAEGDQSGACFRLHLPSPRRPALRLALAA